MAYRKRSKFGVDMTLAGKRKRTFQGQVFDSELELKILKDYLLPLKESGEILEIELQKEYILQPAFTKNGKKNLPIKYKADYVITFKDGTIEVWDAKGFMIDPQAAMKRKMFDYVYPEITLRWMTISMIDGGLVEYEVAKKARAQRKKEKAKAKGKKGD